MKNPGRMENVTRRLVATLLSLSMVILFASASQAAINCTQCHGDGSLSSLPRDTSAALASYRNITTGAVKGNHMTHSGDVTTGGPCARCHGAAAASYASNHAIHLIAKTMKADFETDLTALEEKCAREVTK